MSDIILVTGGAGFIGRHVVRLLQERVDPLQPGLREIRVLDLEPWTNSLQHSESVPVVNFTGSLLDESLVSRALESPSGSFGASVSTVVHCATHRDLKVWQNAQTCERVNVDGTHIILESAINAGVQRLVYVSSVDSLTGFEPIYYGAENTTPAPKSLILDKPPRGREHFLCGLRIIVSFVQFFAIFNHFKTFQ